VLKVLKEIKHRNLPLTAREQAILAVAVVELRDLGINDDTQPVVVQVVGHIHLHNNGAL
jgi:hypothetical protein